MTDEQGPVTPEPDHGEGGGQGEGEQWVTVRVACEQAGLHPNTVRRWHRSGRIASRRTPGPHGEQVEVPLSEVLQQAGRDRPRPSAGSAEVSSPSSELALREAVSAMHDLAHRLQDVEGRAARAEAIVEQREERLRELRAERDRLAAEVERLGGQEAAPWRPPTAPTGAPPSRWRRLLGRRS